MCLNDNRYDDTEFLIDERKAFSGCDAHIVMNRICRELGYTHLIALPAKQNPETMQRLQKRIKTEYPDYHARIQAMAATEKSDVRVSPC
jgi:hypothetical protein